jgi:PAS domain S-box-containing protein
MKNKRGLMYIILMLLTLLILCMFIFINNANSNKLLNYLFFTLVIVVGLSVMALVVNREKNKKLRFREKLFNSLVKSSDTVYIMMDEEKHVTYVSSNVEDVLGLNKANKSDDQIVFEILNIPIIKSELKNLDRDKEYVSQMVQYDNPKYNHKVWIRVKMYPYKEKNANYQVIQIVDATKEHDRQHLLISQASDIKNRESQLNQITSSSYDMELDINLISNTCDLKYFKKDNKYFGDEKREKYTEILKEITDKYINENDKELFYSNLSLSNLKNHFVKYELDSIKFRYRVGNDVKNNTWLESTVFFLSDRGSNKVSILTKNVTEDAESIREQNYLLQNALNDAKLADKSKTDLISTISHDIRTPLTNILGLSDSLLTKKISNEIKEDIENISNSSKEVLNIIDGLLDTSKIEKKVIEKEEKPYNIFRMFKIVEDSAKEFISNKNLKLNVNLDNNLPIILKGDYKRITSAVTSIVNNSIKYTNDGEVNVNVRGEKKDDNVNLTIEISDTGIGMDETKLDKIMNSNDSKDINSVKKLMKLLDGKLEIESKLNEYTKVTLSFVQKIVEDNKIREKLENNKVAEVFDLNGKKVLIVDDNKLNLKVTSRLLEPYKVDVMLIESGIEAIEHIKENNIYDLILLDQMMPAMDGSTTLTKLREIKNFNTPIVVLTADAIVGRKELYLDEGFDDYISKPIDKKELSRVLNKFLKDHE